MWRTGPWRIFFIEYLHVRLNEVGQVFVISTHKGTPFPTPCQYRSSPFLAKMGITPIVTFASLPPLPGGFFIGGLNDQQTV
jgi:hypothetical protein